MLFALLFATVMGADRTGTSEANDAPADCSCLVANGGTGCFSHIKPYEYFICAQPGGGFGYPGEAASAAQSTSNHCDTRENQAGTDYPVNHRCFNWGTCSSIAGIYGYTEAGTGYYGGNCVCADASIPNNWALTNNPTWDTGKYSGQQGTCNTEHTLISARVSYIFYLKYNNAGSSGFGIQGKLVCQGADVNGGAGANYGETGWEPVTPTGVSLLNIVRGTLNYPEAVDLKNDGYTNYGGHIAPTSKDSGQLQHCRICSDTNPCKKKSGSQAGSSEYYGSDTGTSGTGGYVMITYGSDYNAFYDDSCRVGDIIPTDSGGDACVLNQDRGLDASVAWDGATQGDDSGTHHQNHYNHIAEEPTTEPVTPPGINDPNVVSNGLGWKEADGLEIQLRAVFHTQSAEENKQTDPLDPPTRSPTKPPTPTPTLGDTYCFEQGYTHKPEDLAFKGIAQTKGGTNGRGCRYGLKTEWPGGDTTDMCKSPYVICLPAENTPNVGFPNGAPGGAVDPYFSSNHVYTLDDCKKECAYDQRCVGFEFNPTTGQTGACVLIDDVPMEIGSPSADTGITDETKLLAVGDWTTLNGAICYEKTIRADESAPPCNPYFGEEDLSEAMLNCYCPNNRKGFYTKNVHRTVAATKYCGTETNDEISKRIREAQANRMFHLCENWCLFNTQSPRTESWYHDPWMKCWREQYAGIGTHRSYCYRVIRDPYTIEQLFIDTRAANMCDSGTHGGNTNVNTPSPTWMGAAPGSYTWALADQYDSCDDACAKKGNWYCVPDIVENLTSETSMLGYGNPYTALSVDCDSDSDGSDDYTIGQFGWAHPSVGPNGECILRDPATKSSDWTSKTGCNVSIGTGYQRICACAQEP